MPIQTLHLRSNVQGREPAAGTATGQLPIGSIGINFNKDEPFLTIQDSAGAIRRIAGIKVGSAAPATPTAGEAWLDTTIATKPVFKVHDGTAWQGAGSGVSTGGTAPASPLEGDLWVDTSAAGAPVLKVYNGTAFVAVTPDASETVKGVVELATAAETTAGTDATRAVHPAGLKVELDKKADLASPALTGTPTAPTAAAGTNTTQVATTEFVTAAVTAGTPDATATTKGVVQLADGAAVTAGTAGRVVDAAQLKAVSDAVKAEDLWDRTGTEITPKTAGDSVFTSGAVKVGGTTAAPNITVKADGGIVANTNGLVYDAATKRLGLGTSTVNANLHVSNTAGDSEIRITAKSTNQGILRFGNEVDQTLASIRLDSTDDSFRFYGLNDTERVRISGTGAVGIGTTSPGAPLHINGTANNTAITLSVGGAVTGYIGPAGFLGGSDSSMGYRAETGNNHAFFIGASEAARIDSSRRLLVGTSSAFTTAVVSTAYQVGFEKAGGYSAFALKTNSNDADGCYFSLGKSRGTTSDSKTIVSNGDTLGLINFEGADGASMRSGAAIGAYVDGTPGASDLPSRLVFSTTADGASSPTERLRIDRDGNLISPQTYASTTSNAANVNIQPDGRLYRSTSSIKYKTDVETLENQYADALLGCRPVWYRSTCASDNPNFGWWGFIAEEVAAIDPRLVHWKTVEITYDDKGSAVETPCDPEPEGVAYDRFVPHLLNLIKRQGEAIAELRAEVAALKTS